MGFYLSFDQMVVKENDNEEDSQGLGLFGRYGFADSDVNEIRCFWSAGAQYQGPIPSRDDDVVGIGVAQGRLSPAAGFSASHETAMELYYNAQVTPWLSLTPSVQYVFNPGGDHNVDDAVVVGFRLQMAF
jgi:porin